MVIHTTLNLIGRSKMAKRNLDAPVCKVTCFHAEKVEKAKKALPSDRELGGIAHLYSAISSTTRLKILFTLSRGELCVCDIASVIGLSIPATSHQLKHLHNRGLLTFRIDGKMVYYSLKNKEFIDTIKNMRRFLSSP